MRTYTIARKADSWDKIESLPIDLSQLDSNAPIKAFAQICYDDEALYIRETAVEEHIRAEVTDPLGQVCEDSCLEFFFSPIWGDTRYFNIEYNPNACVYLGFGDNVDGKVNLYRLIRNNNLFNPVATRTEDGWRIEYSIPFSFIRHFFPEFNPVSGYKMRANCYKCGDKTVQPHYLTWNFVTTENPDYHTPKDFGKMILE